MDANKLARLREVGYRIGACLACVHFKPGPASTFWGTCQLFRYHHLKHTDADRQLSVHALGRCPSFTPAPHVPGQLRAFAEFLAPGTV